MTDVTDVTTVTTVTTVTNANETREIETYPLDYLLPASITGFKLIGITGKAGAGKDTVAEIMSENYITTIVPMAGPLKAGLEAMMSQMFDLTIDPYSQAGKQFRIPYTNITVREALQFLGTEYFRKYFGEDIHIYANIQSIAIDWQEDWQEDWTQIVTIPDIRFNNEARYVKANNGIIIKVERPFDSVSVPQHESEAGISDKYISHVIVNDGTLRDLEIKVLKLLSKLGI